MTINEKALKKLKAERMLPGPGVCRLVHVKGTLTVTSPLHIGGSDDADFGEKDAKGKQRDNFRRVLREAPSSGVPNAKDLPVIAPTSVKGVVRAWCEGMLGVYEAASDGRLGLSSINGEQRYLKKPEGEDEEVMADPGEAEKDKGDLKEAEGLRTALDLVSGIFGMTRWRGKVEFSGGRLAKDSPEQKAQDLTATVPRVAIDAYLGAAEDSKLFNIEYVKPGAVFEVELRAHNLQDWELGLLFHALESFNHPHFPTRLGGLTQQGYGQVRWKPTETFELGADGTSGGVLTEWMNAVKVEKPGSSVDVGAAKAKVDAWKKAFSERWGALLAADPSGGE